MTLARLLDEVAAGRRSAQPLTSWDGLVTSWWLDGWTVVHPAEAILGTDVAVPSWAEMPQTREALLELRRHA
jgi:hypothetical protein